MSIKLYIVGTKITPFYKYFFLGNYTDQIVLKFVLRVVNFVLHNNIQILNNKTVSITNFL